MYSISMCNRNLDIILDMPSATIHYSQIVNVYYLPLSPRYLLEGTLFYGQQRMTIAHTTNLMQMQDLQSQRKPAYRHEFRINSRNTACNNDSVFVYSTELKYVGY